MRMTESRLRRTIRKAILINEAKKKKTPEEKQAKAVSRDIKKYVKNIWRTEDPRDSYKICSVEAIEEKFKGGLDNPELQWPMVRDFLYNMEHGGPQDGYWYE